MLFQILIIFNVSLIFYFPQINISFVYVSYILRISFVEDKVKVGLSYEEGYYWVGIFYVILILEFQRGLCSLSGRLAMIWQVWLQRLQSRLHRDNIPRNCRYDNYTIRAIAEQLGRHMGWLSQLLQAQLSRKWQ